jgi:hypothetical protein
VQKYIGQSGALGRPKVKTALVKQEGLINQRGKKWMRLKAVQHFNFVTNEFVWVARAGPLRAIDQFVNYKGSLTVKLFKLIKLGESTGPEMDQGEALRYLTELSWFPSALVSPSLSWKSIDDSTVQATLHYDGRSASAFFYFNEAGQLTKMTAKRYAEDKGKFILRDWLINHFEYHSFDGVSIPYKAHVNWMIDGVETCYYKMVNTEVETNIIT